MDDLFLQARDELEDELRENLNREPTPAELKAFIECRLGERAQEKVDDMMAEAYDRAKAIRKGE